MSKINKIVRYSFLFLSHASYTGITSLVPKEKKLWVFGAWEGQLYADNTKYLFEWINKNVKDVCAVWVSNNINAVKEIRSKGYKAELKGSKEAFHVLAHASAIIETEGNADIGGYRPGRCKVIQLWHGVAPKKMNYMKKFGPIETMMLNIITDDRKNSYWMVSSKQNKDIMQGFFGMPDDHVYVTGYPRNDEFVSEQTSSPVLSILDKQFPGMKKLIYMPTHRNFGNNKVSYFSKDDMRKINSFLVMNNYVMVFKPHMHELRNYVGMKTELTNIILATDEKLFGDVYSYINGFDLLICDYSSIEYDFLCSGKPIVLFPYDIEEFRKTDGLFDYYEDMPCGPMCMTWDEVLEESKSLLTCDTWKDQREKCRLIFHPLNDGNNSLRVYESIKKIINY